LLAGALPKTLLGELSAIPQTYSCNWGPIPREGETQSGRGREGRKGKEGKNEKEGEKREKEIQPANLSDASAAYDRTCVAFLSRQ